MALKRGLILLAIASNIQAKSLDSKTVYDLLKKGADLSAQQALEIEDKVHHQPADVESRIELLAFYAAKPNGVDLATVKAARATHILWLIEHDASEGFGLLRVVSGVYRINCRGDELADADSSRMVANAWVEQFRKHPADVEIHRQAVDAVKYCDPERAERLLIEFGDRADLGRLYAISVLGVTGTSYTNSDPAGSDASLRETPFAAKARGILEQSTDPELIGEAASTLLRTGAILWADGKLDWDYTELGTKLLARAKPVAANQIALITAPTELPQKGERPLTMIRVGGNIMAANLIRKVQPVYPAAARELGIQGTVQLTALIGLDGSILYLEPIGGPRELIPASIAAVRQWQYKPTS